MPRALCIKCGHVMDQLLIDQGEDYHVGCRPEEKVAVVFGDPGTKARDPFAAQVRADLMEVIRWADANSARSRQAEVGPSELGHECDRFLAYRLAQWPVINTMTDPWPAIVGTAIHKWLEEAVNAFQAAAGAMRWQTEITIHPDAFTRGHLDLFDHWEHMVCDWKALPTDELVLTPTGWSRMGDLKVGDLVIGSNGKPIRVEGVYPQGVKEVFTVTLNDGSSVEATGDHLWTVYHRHTYQRPDAKSRTVTTSELAAELSKPRSYWVVLPGLGEIQFAGPDGPLPFDPYALGVLLGDGGMSTDTVVLTNFDGLEAAMPQGVTPLAGRPGHFRVQGGATAMRRLGLLGKSSLEKKIPDPYLYASASDRLALLQGLMDSDGCTIKGNAVFCTSSPGLAEGVRWLVWSLGGSVRTFTDRKLRKGATALAHQLSIKLPEPLVPFRAPIGTKLGRWRRGRTHRRFVRSIAPSRTTETVCIKVAADDGLFVTRDFIVTHNTLGPTKMKSWLKHGPPEKYKDQVNLYAKGVIAAGREVRKVCLIGLPRSGWLEDMDVWVDDYRPERAQAALDRQYTIAAKVRDVDVFTNPHMFNEFTAVPDMCNFCPFFRPTHREGTIADASGCPGR